jgi:hypothetical protein
MASPSQQTKTPVCEMHTHVDARKKAPTHLFSGSQKQRKREGESEDRPNAQRPYFPPLCNWQPLSLFSFTSLGLARRWGEGRGESRSSLSCLPGWLFLLLLQPAFLFFFFFFTKLSHSQCRTGEVFPRLQIFEDSQSHAKCLLASVFLCTPFLAPFPFLRLSVCLLCSYEVSLSFFPTAILATRASSYEENVQVENDYGRMYVFVCVCVCMCMCMCVCVCVFVCAKSSYTSWCGCHARWLLFSLPVSFVSIYLSNYLPFIGTEET